MKTTFSLTEREFAMYQLGVIHSKDQIKFDQEFMKIFKRE